MKKRNDPENSLLHIAVKEGNLENVKNLIKQNPKLINIKNNNGDSPLHMVKDAEIAKVLIEAGADVNAKNNKDASPLSCLAIDKASANYIDKDELVAKVLIKAGADPSIMVETTYGPKKLVEDNLIEKCFKEAVQENDLAAIKNIEIKDATVKRVMNEQNSKGNTIMHEAVIANDTGLVRALLDKGADVNSQNHNNMSLLQIAASPGNTKAGVNDNEMVTILLEKGADANSRDKLGHTPLFFAKNVEVAKALIEHGADVKAFNEQNESLLDSVKDPEIAKLVIDNLKKNNLKTTITEAELDKARSDLKHKSTVETIPSNATAESTTGQVPKNISPNINTTKGTTTKNIRTKAMNRVNRLGQSLRSFFTPAKNVPLTTSTIDASKEKNQSATPTDKVETASIQPAKANSRVSSAIRSINSFLSSASAAISSPSTTPSKSASKGKNQRG